MKTKAVLTAMLATGLFGAALAQDWGEGDDVFADNPAFEPSRALCRQVRDREPPASDRPDAAMRASLAGCDSEVLYYGIGMPADPERARLCAFAEIAEERDHAPLSGRVILMTIYANGVGARRDFDVATHLACNVEGAPMESHGRVTRLAELRAQGWTDTDFHYCDDITSGLAAGYCAGHEARIAEVGRAAALAALNERLTPPQRRAYAALEAARDAFIGAHGDGEVDMSGTLRVALSIGAREAAHEAFLDTMRRLDARRLPAAAFAEADAALNSAYTARREELWREARGTVTWEQVRAAQRAWLRYRDTFLAFAARAYPAMPRDHLAAWLTAQRTRMLTDPG
ncbi:MAG: DUF1311 domain-containing protein [Sphingomonas sp.]|nr:DUF1311 domain-containing protein [Sphingomonas sp.]